MNKNKNQNENNIRHAIFECCITTINKKIRYFRTEKSKILRIAFFFSGKPIKYRIF